MPRPFVSEIRENQRVQGIYLASRKSLLATRAGAPYLSVTLQDRTGDIEGRVWDDAERLDQSFEKGSFVKVDAVASEYNGRLQLKVEALRPVADDQVDPRDFLPATRFDVEQMWGELCALVDGVAQPHIRALLRSMLDDPEIGRGLRRAPAAKGVHHPFLGGLLEHTLSVTQLAHRIADHYPRVDRDLLVAGAVLHDLGKVRELGWERGIDYTTEGRLVGHMLLCVQWIREKASRIEGFPSGLEMHLVHLVAAHHGELQHGAAKVPQTLEAMLLNMVDEVDSRVQSWTQILTQDGRTDSGAEWTEFQRLYDRFLFKGPGWSRRGEPGGAAWSGTSLYRREREAGVHAPGAGAPPRGAADAGVRPAARVERRLRTETAAADRADEPTAPAMPDLFARRRG